MRRLLGSVRQGGVAAAAAASLLLVLLPASPARAERTVTITGGGWGHGIGMSQYGAYGRALNGKSAAEILEHYYSGAKVSAIDLPGQVRVGLLPNYGSTTGSISFGSEPGGGEGDLIVKVAGARRKIAQGNSGDQWRVEAGPTGGFRIYKNGEQVRRDGESVFGGVSEPLQLKFAALGSLLEVTGKSSKYAHGHAEIASYSSDSCPSGYCARLVLQLSMQKYLYGLGEVPSSWPAAVLRAQAIAGRTYAFEKITRLGQNRYPCGCAVYDSTIDQAYIGDAKRTGSGSYWAAWKAAVDDTKSQVILFDGSPIQALYSSSSGGHTEHNENVWGGTAIPYLRGVPDGPDRAEGANPNFKWTVEMPFSSFSSKLNAAYGTGEVQDFQLLKPFGVSGRVAIPIGDQRGARIEGTIKTSRASGWSLRSALGLKDSLFRVDLGYEVARRFRPKYNSLDGAPGEPVGDPYKVPRGSSRPQGTAQDFSKGRMTYNRAANTVVWQWGKVLKAYDSARRERGPLGMPESGVWGPGDHLGSNYRGGRIVWSTGNGAWPLLGAFEDAFLRVGGIEGTLGFPVGARRLRDEWPNGGRRQRFTGGTLYRPGGQAEAFALWGAIDERYRKMGEAASACGYPTGDVTETDNGLRGEFQNGAILWRSATGVEVNCG